MAARNFVVALLATMLPVAAQAQMQVLTVPYAQHDPSVPHPAYNGRPVRFKAIARGSCDRPYFRWDLDGNGNWDRCLNRNPAIANGTWHQDLRHSLDCLQYLPEVDPQDTPKKLFLATVEVACTVSTSGVPTDSHFATYRVLVDASVPRARPARSDTKTYAWSARPPVTAAVCTSGICSETGSPCASDADCEGDTAETLAVKRAVAVGDALWWLHKELSRSGEGTNAITATLPRQNYDAEPAFLRALATSGHLPAYPPNAYQHGSFSDVAPLPSGWQEANDFRYDTDPYAEDAARLLNTLLGRLQASQPPDATSEGDDGLPPIAGTNNGAGYFYRDNREAGQLLAAIAASGMGGTSAQVGPAAGHSIEYVVQELVDALCYYQLDSTSIPGGWGYFFRTAFYADSSHVALVGLDVASSAFARHGVIVNRDCRNAVAHYVLAAQDVNGSGFWLEGRPANDPHFTAALVHAHAFLGTPALPYDQSASFAPQSTYTNAQLHDGLEAAFTYLANTWSDGFGGCNWSYPDARFDGLGKGTIYTRFGTAEALERLQPSPALLGGSIDWAADFAYTAVNDQHEDGLFIHDASIVAYTDFYNGALSRHLVTAWTAALATPNLLDPPPVAVATADPRFVTEGCAGSAEGAVTFDHSNSFTASRSRRIVEYQWLFDTDPAAPAFSSVDWGAIPDGGFSADGKAWRSSSEDARPVFRYLACGTYSAALRVLDDDSPPKSDIAVIQGIQVDAQPELPPTATAGGPYAIEPGADLVLAGQVDDPNLACRPTESIAVAWYLDGDATPDYTQPAGTLTGATLQSLALPTDQWLDIRMVATDSSGNTAEDPARLLIAADRPVADVQVSGAPACGSEVTFDASRSLHTSSQRALVSWDWDFGDGGSASGQVVRHVFASSGDYEVTLTVADDGAPQKRDQLTIPISVSLGENLAPLADAGGPYLTYPGSTIRLYGTNSYEANEPCGDRIVSWLWDLDNDGVYEDLGPRVDFTLPASWIAGTRHPIALEVVDSTGLVSYPALTTIEVYAEAGPGPCSAVSFQASHASPQPSSEVIRLLASPTCPIAVSAEYRFWFQDPAGTWQLGRDWHTDSRFFWGPVSTPGAYQLKVEVRSSTSTAEFDAVSAEQTFERLAPPTPAASLETSLPSPQVFDTAVTLTASSSDVATPEYRFFIADPAGTWTSPGWQAASTLQWSAPTRGAWRLKVCARAAGTTSAGDACSAELPFERIGRPPAGMADSFAVDEDGRLDVAAPGVLGNDDDPDGDGLTASLVSGPAHGALALEADGSFSFVPDPDFHGADGFTYRATDSESLQSEPVAVTLTVAPTADAPVAGDDAYEVAEDSSLTIASPGVLGNDADADADALTAALVAPPAHGTLALETDGSFTYTPAADFHGSDAFTYLASDGALESSPASVTLTVTPVNDAPSAADDSYEVDEDGTLSVVAPGVLENDGDADGDSLTVTLVTGPAHGTLALGADGAFTFTPDPDFHGSDGFVYQASDGVLESTASVALAVNAVNDRPEPGDDAFETEEDAPLYVAAPGVLENDADRDGDALSAVLVVQPAHGTLLLGSDGAFSYLPDPDFAGTDVFQYAADDGSTQLDSAEVAITVKPVNDAPVAADDSYELGEESTLTIDVPGVLDNDEDVDGDALAATLRTEPAHGTVTLAADGSFTYRPEAGFSGSDRFTYTASDGLLDSDEATVTLVVAGVNHAPVAAADSYTATAGQPLVMGAPGLLGNDTDEDGDPLTAVLVTEPEHGALDLAFDGSLEYTPEPGFSGEDTFTYVANDGAADSAPATVSIHVLAPAEPAVTESGCGCSGAAGQGLGNAFASVLVLLGLASRRRRA